MVTGVQLGMMKALAEHDPAVVKNLIVKIQDEQYAGESEMEISEFAKEVRHHCSDEGV